MGSIISGGTIATTSSVVSVTDRTWRDLISDAFYEIGSYAYGEPVNAEHLELGRKRLNQIIDQWKARKVFAYNVNFTSYTLTPNHQPHLIGPGLASPDFDAARPVRIENASIVLTGNVDVPLAMWDDDNWAAQRVKTVTSNVPIGLYYSPDSPNGSLYLWPVPTAAYGLRLETWVGVDQIADTELDDDFSNPYGYELALMYTLAEKLCRPMSKSLTADLASDAHNARMAIQKNNIKSPRTSSAGFRPPSGGRRGDFNWATGTKA